MREIEVGLHGLQLQVDLTPLENEPLRAVRALRLYDERYVLLTAADGAHGRAARVRWADAAAAGRLGLLSRDMQHRRIVDGAFAAVGAEPRPVVETNSIATLSAHARDGLAAAVMAHTWLRLFPVPPGMRAVPLSEPELRRPVGVVWLDRRPEPILPRALIAIARAAALGARLGGHRLSGRPPGEDGRAAVPDVATRRRRLWKEDAAPRHRVATRR